MYYVPRYVISVLAGVATWAVTGSRADAQSATEFSGPRVEATVGLDHLRFDLKDTTAPGRGKASDVGYGFAVGYDMVLSDKLIAGVEAGLSLSDDGAATGTTTATDYLKRRELSAAVRVGMAITPTALVYGKVGYANLGFRDDRTGVGNARRYYDGVLLGIGTEVKISRAAFLKAEYRYTDYAGGYVGNKVMTGIGIRF